jgi:ABC-type glycerol-3-phosphate transport system substrate-binding protein
MSLIKKLALGTALSVIAGTSAFAAGHSTDCGIENGRVSIVGNEFMAIQTVGAAAQACANDSVEIKANLTADHQKINVAGMSANPAEYTSAIVANSSIVALLNDDLVRPLDDLVAKHGDGLLPNQLIQIDGKTMAVAFMANAQHLVYRKDILEQAGIEVPTSYEEVLAGAEKIREMGILEYPLGGPLMVGDSGVPATTLWWDGWTVSKNISDEDAEATFIALKNGIDPSILNEETMELAVWLIDGYEPTPAAAGVFATVQAGAKPYPMRPFQGLLHTALGAELPDFMTGKESAEKTLQDIEDAYTAAATEKGFL